MNKQDIINFEKEIFDLYDNGKITGVIHLAGSTDGKYEEWLVNFFKQVKKQDWVFSNHRNHYHMLLKAGKKFTKDNIMNKNSMHQYSRKHKVFTSGIVCGSVPIALGVALGIKLKKGKEHVYCFVGDMASHMGSFNICVKYAYGHNLPITFIIEDNEIAVYTPTKKTWPYPFLYRNNHMVKYIKYKRKYPHHGTGKFIHF